MKFSALLPTRVPGISFTGQGRILYRRNDIVSEGRISVAAARAVSLLEAYDLVREVTRELPPEDVYQAEREAVLLLADWRAAKRHPGVRFKGRVRLFLASADAARAEKFNESRRASRLDEAVIRDRFEFIRTVALKNPSSARLWWLYHNLEEVRSEIPWEVFDAVAQPLVVHADLAEDDAARLAKPVADLIGRLLEDPERLRALALVASSLGWSDLAEEIEMLIAGSGPESRGQLDARSPNGEVSKLSG